MTISIIIQQLIKLQAGVHVTLTPLQFTCTFTLTLRGIPVTHSIQNIVIRSYDQKFSHTLTTHGHPLTHPPLAPLTHSPLAPPHKLTLSTPSHTHP